ncbi:MAG TPA: dTDP-4-dehydrorhamnose 3,5-epimerase [Ilumatobacteraceae bacterium]|nr:dTDP-4-dehydrorhamnose 3,5-epimerase [Ilumatobacteraceae bacterium]
MKFIPTSIAGAVMVDLEPRSDDRGFFARSFCRDEFEAAGLEPAVAQCNVSYNRRAGTLRGLHFQTADAPEAKLVRCTRGAIFDVIVDLRPDSATLGEHVAVELTSDNRRALYIPPLFAHGYQTLDDDVEVLYQVSQPYTPNTERGLRFDDPVLAIDWPAAPSMITDKDRQWPLLGDAAALGDLAGVSS